MIFKVGKINTVCLVMLVILTLGFGRSAHAQLQGNISGTVFDSGTESGLPGVNVVVMGTYHGAATDLDGKFIIRGVSAGTYSLKIQFMGYKTVEWTGVEVTPGITTELEVPMEQTVLAMGQEVVIIGKKALFDIEETASRRSISADEIRNSVVENTQDIVSNQVGVVESDDEIHIRGGRSYENAYLLDGLSVQDPLSGTGFGLQLSANAIEEVEVITGGFAAEYGQAMSGVVNVKTKEGTGNYHGSLSYKTDDLGNYEEPGLPVEDELTQKSTSSFNTDVVEMSLDGPDPFFGLLLPRLGLDLPGTQTFFANAYMFISDNFTRISADTLYSSTFHGRKYAPRENNNWSAMLKYTWAITPKHKLQGSYNSSVSINQNTQSLQTNLEYVPPGPGYPYRFQENLDNFNTFTHFNRQLSLNWTHTLSSMTFYELKLSNFFTNLRSDVDGKYWNEYTEPEDIVTLPIEYFCAEIFFGVEDSCTGRTDVFVFPGDGFYDFGNGFTWHDHWVEEWTVKGDLTHHSAEHHELKAGFESSFQEMQLIDVYAPWFGELGLNNDMYHVYPSFGGLYVQDKISFDGLIANVGLRFDYWLPGEYVERAIEDTNIVTVTPATRAAFEEDTYTNFGRKWKARMSPRIGISHPVSDRQVLFFSYGHFSKRPKPQFVYAKLGPNSAKSTFQEFGNPNLNPETTVAYELGIKHRLTEDDVLTVTAFYKDIFDYVTTISFRGYGRLAKRRFTTYLNLDYSRVRGIEAEYKTRMGDYLSGSINGSYSIATGKSSSPHDVSLVARGDIPEKKITEDFLVWDRPWQFSFNLNYHVGEGMGPRLFFLQLPDNWNINLRYFAQAGDRYTPQFATGDTLLDGRLQYTGDLDRDGFPDELYTYTADYWAWLDVNIKKSFRVAGVELSLNMEVLNLLNRKNSNIINPVTGRAYEYGDPTPNGWNDPMFPDVQAPISPFPYNPARYLNQRNIRAGFSVVW